MTELTPRDRWLGRGPERTEADKKAGLRLASAAARKQDLATSSRDNAIRFAYESGNSLREIAEVTGLGHSTIKRIVDRTAEQSNHA
jgi:hypothetical protein